METANMGFMGILNSAQKKAAEIVVAEQGDYIGEDGLLHCGKCRTPKQGRYEMPWGTVTPMVLCKCMQERLDRENEERRLAELRRQIAEYRRIGFPESKMQEWTFENANGANEKVISAMRNYVAKFDEFRSRGKGLLLYGEVGTGKSFAAACVANALIDEGIPVLMTNFIRIANTLGGMWEGKQEYYDRLNDFPLLILDDLAAERKTEYMAEIVFNVIDARYRAGLPLIVTTNLTGDELQSATDMTYKRAFSRLYEMCVPVKVEGKDRRAETLRTDIGEMRDMLGI